MARRAPGTASGARSLSPVEELSAFTANVATSRWALERRETQVVRRMAQPAFRQSQIGGIYAPHVAPLNRYVDDLGSKPREGKPPYIAPMYFGVTGHALGVFRDPGPKAGGVKGSGFLCVENDDATAERMMLFAEHAAVDVREVTPWNAYPWYINAKPTTKQLTAGLKPLLHVAGLMPELRVVIFFGGSAHHAAQLLERTHPGLLARRGIATLTTYHTSRQALWTKDPNERARREQHVLETLQRAADLIRHAA